MAKDFKIIRSREGHTYVYDAEQVRINRLQGAEHIADNDLEDIFTRKFPSDTDNQPISTKTSIKENLRKVERLTLVLLNRCNIACEYCYEVEGTFGLKYTKMSTETAMATIDTIYDAYDEVATLMFFGGEPLILYRMFPQICDYVIDKCNKLGVTAPNFGLITNGTLVNGKIIEVLKKYNISVTVSIDGPEDTHDLFRKSKMGTGTFAGAEKGYNALRDAGVLTSIQSTLDERHLENSDVKSIVTFLNEKLGCESPHVTAAAVNGVDELKPSLATGFADASREYLSALLNGGTTPRFSHVESIVRSLIVQRKSSYTCPAGFEIAVSPEGDLYPCFMFVGNDDLRLGSVHNGIDDAYWDKLASFLGVSRKEDRLGCSTCWARNLCSSCMGNNLNTTGLLEKNPKFHCDIIRTSAEEIIGFLGDLQLRPHDWGRFVENARAPVTQQSC